MTPHGSARRPVRTCVGCRGTGARDELVRLVALAPAAVQQDGPITVVVDEAGRMPGRGAWLHPEPRCWELAERRRAIGRALRISGSLELGLVRDWFERLNRHAARRG